MRVMEMKWVKVCMNSLQYSYSCKFSINFIFPNKSYYITCYNNISRQNLYYDECCSLLPPIFHVSH